MGSDEGLEVRGGVAGLAARTEELLALAAAYDDAAGRMAAWAARGAECATDVDLLASAVLAPSSFAEAEARVLAATVGPDGVGTEALGWQGDAVALRLLVSRLRSTDDLVASGFGMLGAAVVTAPTWLPMAADLVSRLYPHGRAHARRQPGLEVPASRHAPRGVEDLVTHLLQLSAMTGPVAPGAVEVQTLTSPDGRVRHVVYLPGTDDMHTLPWSRDGDVRDMGVNLELAAGGDNEYADGVLSALEQAGVARDEPVLLAGHSQGGMLAARLLSDAEEHGYATTHAVVLGAPVGQVEEYPAGTRLLALEHRGDVVPLLDSGPNPDTRAQVTVRFESDEPGTSGLEGAHSYPAYADGAALVDASTHPSVREQVASLEADGFLATPDGTAVTSQVFQVTRGP